MMQQCSRDDLWLVSIRGQPGALPIIFIYYTIKHVLSHIEPWLYGMHVETISILGVVRVSSVYAWGGELEVMVRTLCVCVCVCADGY